MSSELCVLLLSDLHLDSPSGGQDLLGKDVFKENIDNLSTAVLETIHPCDKLSGILFAGDLLNEGKVENLSHGRDVLNYICKAFAIARSKFVWCHGNHDFDRSEAVGSGYAAAIRNVRRALREFGQPRADAANPLGALHKLAPGVFVLALDSMLGGDPAKPNRPGKPPYPHDAGLVELVRNNVKPQDALIVASHHPLDDFNLPIKRAEERLWHDGRLFADRLSKVRETAAGPSLWVSGDLHLPLKPKSYGAFSCILGGHLAGTHLFPSNEKPGVVLIRLKRGEQKGFCQRLQLQQGHSTERSGGEWERFERLSFPPNEHRRPQGDGRTRRTKRSKAKTTSGGRPKPNHSIELFADSIQSVSAGGPTLEETIIATIGREKLYHLGRFETSQKRVSLGWVSIGPLLAGIRASTPLLPAVVSEMTQWIQSKLGNYGLNPGKKVVLLGIDCWGAIMASQVSLTTAWKNFCIAGRAGGVYHTMFERVTDRVLGEINEASAVVMIADAISSGETIRKVFDEISAFKDKDGRRLNGRKRLWLAAGVLCDESLAAASIFPALKAIGCACRRLPLPQIAVDRLPTTDILPPDLSFIVSKSDEEVIS
jgi:hypothetical protein